MNSKGDKIFARDSDGRVYSLVCVIEQPDYRENVLPVKRYTTTLGDKLITSDGINFTLKSSGKIIRKI